MNQDFGEFRKDRKELDDNIREVIELVLTRIGKSKFEIAEIIRDFEASGDDQITLYDAEDIETCEQMKF